MHYEKVKVNPLILSQFLLTLLVYFLYDPHPQGGTSMMIPQADVLALMARNIGKHVGVNALRTDAAMNFMTEGILKSTTFGVLTLEDGFGGFSPSVHVDDISSFTIGGDFYVVEFPSDEPDKVYHVVRVWANGDTTPVDQTKAQDEHSALIKVLRADMCRMLRTFNYKGKDYDVYTFLFDFSSPDFIAVEVK